MAAMVATAPSCTNATTNSISVTWVMPLSSLPFGRVLYEAQLGLESENAYPDTEFAPFLATSAYSPSVVAKDLLPGTSYVIKMRMRTAFTHEWSNLTQAVECATSPLAAGQPLVLPPQTPPTLTSITVAVDRNATAHGRVVIEARREGSSGPWTSPPTPLGADFTAVLSGLDPATIYEVRARSQDGQGPASDVVLQKTATPGASNLTVFRISELCGATHHYSYEGTEYDRPCEPDYLHNHDSGTLLADVEFITATQGSGFVPDFNGSVVSRYCVSRAAGETADYVSCNGRNTEHYRCACNNFIDRCIGRADTSACRVAPRRTPSGTYNVTECFCSARSTWRSRRHIGSMPVYYPFPRFHHHFPPATSQCTPELVPPPAESVYLGEWYSMPEEAECDSDATHLPGKSGCTWARRSTLHLVRGFQLLAAGFSYGRAYDAATLKHNEQVVETVMARHPARCCDC